MKAEIQDGEGDADIRVASTERHFPDDLEGECSKCHRAVFYRPEPPYLIPFVCIDCALPIFAADKNPKIRLSSKTVATVRKLFKKPNV